jgi:hypothetical protein
VTAAKISDTFEFTVASNTCAGQVAADTLCTVTVDFTPTTAGPASTVLTFTDDADPATQQVPLAGTGQPQQATSSTGTTTPTTPSSGTATQPVLQ